MEYSKKQLDIIYNKEKKSVVIAAAAAGKTATLTARVKYLLDNGADPLGIVAITFTNLAAEEIRERVGSKAKDCFIGTIHSYCNFLLRSAGISTQELIDKEKFDELFELVKKHPECLRHVDHLLLDEAQDSNAQQFEFLLDYVCPANFMFVGDLRQCIYRFNKSDPTCLMNIMKEPDVVVYDLNENYRNGTDILDYAKQLIRQNGSGFIDNSIPMREEKGKVITIEYTPRGIARTIKRMGNYKDWFILSRYNRDIEDLSYAFEVEGVPACIIRKADFSSNKELHDKLEEDSIKIMTIHASKGLEANNVVVVGAVFNKKGTLEEREENLCINYVAATRAKNLLVWTYKTYHQKKSVSNWE